MFRRCTNPKQLGYENYGGRGITIDPSWANFENFLKDMGEQPVGSTLDRKHPDLGYSWLNCEWASPLEQARNKRTTRWLSYGGETLCLTVWAERLGVKPKTLRARLDDYGWSLERALTTPVMTHQESAQLACAALKLIRAR